MNQLRPGDGRGGCGCDGVRLGDMELLVMDLAQSLLDQTEYDEPADDSQDDQVDIKRRSKWRVPGHVEQDRDGHRSQEAAIEEHVQLEGLIAFYAPQGASGDRRPRHMPEGSEEGADLDHVEHDVHLAALFQELEGIAGALEERESGAHRGAIEKAVQDVLSFE